MSRVAFSVVASLLLAACGPKPAPAPIPVMPTEGDSNVAKPTTPNTASGPDAWAGSPA